MPRDNFETSPSLISARRKLQGSRRGLARLNMELAMANSTSVSSGNSGGSSTGASAGGGTGILTDIVGGGDGGGGILIGPVLEGNER